MLHAVFAQMQVTVGHLISSVASLSCLCLISMLSKILPRVHNPILPVKLFFLKEVN